MSRFVRQRHVKAGNKVDTLHSVIESTRSYWSYSPFLWLVLLLNEVRLYQGLAIAGAIR
jgi:hypothetical protein